MRSSFLLVLFSVRLAFCAIDGTVVNKTTNQPAANIGITLVKPGQGGMRTLGTTTSDSTGHFSFQNDEPRGGPQLLQAAFNGVNYNKLLTPATPTSDVELDIYAVTKSADILQTAQQFMVFEPDQSKIAVDETVIFQNTSTRTFNDDQTGSFRFFLPRAANGQVRVNVQGPQGMPLPRAAEKTEEPDVFKIAYPIKPGETQFEINYAIPAGSPFTFRGRTIEIKGLKLGPLRLIAPSGVTLTGTDLKSIGVEPKTQATIYNVLSPAFSFDIAGVGSLHPPEAEGPDSTDSPSIVQGIPQIYRYLPWLTGIVLGVLAIGLFVLYRTSPVRSPYGS